MLAQCREDKEVRMMMQEGLAGQMLGVIANSNLVVWMRNSWLRTFNMLLPGSNYKLRELLERALSRTLSSWWTLSTPVGTTTCSPPW